MSGVDTFVKSYSLLMLINDKDGAVVEILNKVVKDTQKIFYVTDYLSH